MTRRTVSLTALPAALTLGAALLTGAPAQQPARAARPITVAEAQEVLAPLIESYGASGMEGPVRAVVQRLLPGWAHPEADTAGNLWLKVGSGPVVVFVAHMDEIGYRVSAIRDDGTLEIRPLGGFFPSLFEARPALVHTAGRDVPGVFTPRDSLGDPPRRTPPPFRVDVGATSRAQAAALGVEVGSTVTMPKEYVRLAGTRATGRSFDDRVGVAAQILAVRHLDRAKLRHTVVFIWSVREEIGLEGAAAAARELGLGASRVHAIDTFVSADSPLELPNFAVAPIGAGAVARAVDNSAVTPPSLLDTLVRLARRRGVALQVGTTNGGNDGSVFAPWGVPDVAIGWPLRYSHSPAEVVDLKDVASLASMIQAVAEAW
jgi:putative aminopeptidase FrvX